MTCNLDFDGTVVSQAFPRVGKNIGAQAVLKELLYNKHKLILFTVRWDSPTNPENNYLTQAVNWFKDNDIELYGVQSDPEQSSWTNSPKSCAQFMIDDSAIGCPLTTDTSISLKPYADWEKIREILIQKGIIKIPIDTQTEN